jgi:hypothetical protein
MRIPDIPLPGTVYRPLPEGHGMRFPDIPLPGTVYRPLPEGDDMRFPDIPLPGTVSPPEKTGSAQTLFRKGKPDNIGTIRPVNCRNRKGGPMKPVHRLPPGRPVLDRTGRVSRVSANPCLIPGSEKESRMSANPRLVTGTGEVIP